MLSDLDKARIGHISKDFFAISGCTAASKSATVLVVIYIKCIFPFWWYVEITPYKNSIQQLMLPFDSSFSKVLLDLSATS